MTESQFERFIEAINNLAEMLRQSRYPIYVREPYIPATIPPYNPYPNTNPPYVPPFISPTVPNWRTPSIVTCEPWLSPTVVVKGDFVSGFSVAQADGDSVGGLSVQVTPTDEISRCIR